MCRNELSPLRDEVEFVADAESVAADDDGVIDVSVTSRNHGDYDDDVREHWRQSSRHHDRSMITLDYEQFGL